jgi:hypothetical protein
MRSKSRKRNGKSRNTPRSQEHDSSSFELKRLSTVLEEYGVAAEEGAVEKVSRLAEEIVEIIARNRKRVALPATFIAESNDNPLMKEPRFMKPDEVTPVADGDAI